MIIACYARKSNDKKSDSIENQLTTIEKYILQQKDLSGADIVRFVDDGVSGMNIERDNFQALLAKIREREIDVVVVKDLSRLGRNYLDVVKLTESIFPFMKVRLIAVSDGYDSKSNSDLPMDLTVTLKAILNEFYLTQTAEKSRNSFAHRIRNGAFYGSIAFGYELSHERKPIIDEKKADIVRDVFNLCLEGKTTLDIARILNERGIRTNRDNQWQSSAIRLMLTNSQYIGVKKALTTVKDIKTKQRRPSKESEIYINDSAFPPIIECEIFNRVQEILPEKKKQHVPEKHIMARKLYCAYCKKTLRRNKNFSCQNSSLTGAQPCFRGTLKHDILYPTVLRKVKIYIGGEVNSAKRSYSSFSDKQKFEDELTKLKEKRAEIYENFLYELTTEEQFQKQKVTINGKIEKLYGKLENWRKQQAIYTKLNNEERPIDILKRLYNANELTKEHMQFVKIINVYSADNFDIILHDDSPLSVLCRNISIYEEV